MFKKIILLLCLATPLSSWAQQEQPPAPEKKKKVLQSMYFSWGYNMEWYTRSSVHVKQADLNSNYTLNNVKTHDNPGWTTGIFNKAFTIPQYNYRIGYMFNEEKGWGVEINFDHTKHIIKEPQDVRVTGTLHGQPVDTVINFDKSNGFYYYLNNGANFLLFNVVKRWDVVQDPSGHVKASLWGKAGIGPVIPHVQNSLWGQANDPGFQFGGWNIGLEAGLRCTFYNFVYLEYCNKLDYARYSNLQVYKGTAKEAFGTYEMILNLGIAIPVKRKAVF